MPDEIAAGPGAGAPPPGPPSPPLPAMGGAGPTGPAAVPSPNRGLEAQAMVEVSAALKMLKRAYARMPAGDPREKALHTALGKLESLFGPASEGLEKSEIDVLKATQPGTQAPGPQQGQAFAQMIKSMNQGRGIGAGAPPPSAPPGGAAPPGA